jgi:hypothetical protein
LQVAVAVVEQKKLQLVLAAAVAVIVNFLLNL